MRVHVHTKFCLLCVLTFLFHQCSHCHDHHDGHHHGDHHHVHNDLQISQAPYMRGATLSPGSKSPPDDSLEEEQQLYIQKLFRRYGHKDRLDFHDFQSLLFSLGLGEVKMVGMDHEDLGHDHVAHLDLLDVQEGLHSHLPTHDGHGHGHGHGHPPQRPNSHHHHHHHPHTEQGHTHCSQQATDASPTTDSGPLKVHDQQHDRTKEQDNDDKPHHGQGSEHDHPNQTQTSADIPPTHPKQTPSAPEEPSPVPQEQQPEAAVPEAAAPAPDAFTTKPSATPTPPTNSRPKRLRKQGKGQKDRNKTSSPLTPPPVERAHSTHDHDHDHDHDHQQEQSQGHGHSRSHKNKREAPGGPVPPTLPGPTLPVHPEHQHEECLNLTQLLNNYGLSSDSPISPSQFTYLCPALLYQIDSRVCIRHYHQMDVEQEALEPVTSAWVWMWGFVSITIISLLSLLGVVLVPFLKQSCFKFLLTFLVALAVGTLSGDALLHLLPHSLGQHDHSHSEQSEESKEPVDLLVDFDGVWKGLTALAGIYFLFIIEHCIGMFKHFKDQGGSVCGRKKRSEEGKIGRKLSDHKLNRRSDAEWLHLKPLTEGLDSTVISCDNGHNDTQLTELNAPDSPTNKTPLAPTDPQYRPQSPVKENGRRAKRHGHGHGHSHGGNCHSDQEMKDAGIASIAWMVIMGDGMHNFSDGLAIGAAFSANITGGISTSVAVFCHELPHELGDFAVLLKAGMSVKQAIAYNLLSALMAYLGMLIGTAVGQYAHNITSWIFAITAGMFLYVALVDMLPEMLHGDSEEHKRCQLGHFVLQNLGLLTGFAIMLLIAIFEDQIVLDFGF